MTRLKLSDIADEKPVKLTIEIPARLHSDLVAYGVVINGANAAAYEREFAGELVASIKDLESDPLGLVFRKGDENVAAFNEGLKAISDDGTLDALVAKYWGLK